MSFQVGIGSAGGTFFCLCNPLQTMLVADVHEERIKDEFFKDLLEIAKKKIVLNITYIFQDLCCFTSWRIY